jgi:hypothetical protein
VHLPRPLALHRGTPGLNPVLPRCPEPTLQGAHLREGTVGKRVPQCHADAAGAPGGMLLAQRECGLVHVGIAGALGATPIVARFQTRLSFPLIPAPPIAEGGIRDVQAGGNIDEEMAFGVELGHLFTKRNRPSSGHRRPPGMKRTQTEYQKGITKRHFSSNSMTRDSDS